MKEEDLVFEEKSSKTKVTKESSEIILSTEAQKLSKKRDSSRKGEEDAPTSQINIKHKTHRWGLQLLLFPFEFNEMSQILWIFWNIGWLGRVWWLVMDGYTMLMIFVTIWVTCICSYPHVFQFTLLKFYKFLQLQETTFGFRFTREQITWLHPVYCYYISKSVEGTTSADPHPCVTCPTPTWGPALPSGRYNGWW